MQTTHSELPGPSTGLGAEGVTGVPGVSGGLGVWKVDELGRNGGEDGDGAGISSRWTALHAPGEEDHTCICFSDLNYSFSVSRALQTLPILSIK